jgi:hypothetical protein
MTIDREGLGPTGVRANALEERKVLFLDVDGVLNSSRSRSFLALSKPMLKRLAGIVEETGCLIVLSSTWRRDPEAVSRLRRHLKFRKVGIYDKTKTLGGIRGEEIQEWLDRNGADRYAILDDDSDMLDEHLPHFFQTDYDYGLTKTIAYRVAHHLGTKSRTRAAPNP